MFLNTLEGLNVFHQDIPKFPMGKYAHIIVLRETNSFALFQTDGELNISRVNMGRARRDDQKPRQRECRSPLSNSRGRIGPARPRS